MEKTPGAGRFTDNKHDMGSYLQILALVVIGVVLVWFGYTIFFSLGHRGPVIFPKKQKRKKRKPRGEGVPGAGQTCPVCSARLGKGELVKSAAFPSFNGKDRLMHIKGCTYCLNGDRKRICPVCGTPLAWNEILIARIFERPRRRSHVHVLGCTRCRGLGTRAAR